MKKNKGLRLLLSRRILQAHRLYVKKMSLELISILRKKLTGKFKPDNIHQI